METIDVGMGDYKICGNEHTLSISGLGSCIAVILYDPLLKLAGLAHIMLPEITYSGGRNFNPLRFADTGIRLMLKEMSTQGAEKKRVKAYLVGGANLFSAISPAVLMDIGKKNIHAVKRVLAQEQIPVIAEDTAGDYGRTIEFYPSTGELWVKSFKYGRKKL